MIYTRSLPANIAVVWSGMFNLFGVLMSTGAVAFGIVSLLPVELILQVGSGAGFAMVFCAADRGDHLERRHLVFRPARLKLAHPDRIDHGRRHHQRAAARPHGTSGVDWSQAAGIGKALLLSPLFGFALAALLLFVLKTVICRM